MEKTEAQNVEELSDDKLEKSSGGVSMICRECPNYHKESFQAGKTCSDCDKLTVKPFLL